MTVAKDFFGRIGAFLAAARQAKNLTQEDVEKTLTLGPGWVAAFEAGRVIPSLSVLMQLCRAIGVPPQAAFAAAGDIPEGFEPERALYAEQSNKDLNVHFTYAKHDAIYELKNATLAQFEVVIRVMRDGLARLANAGDAPQNAVEAMKATAVADAFMKAIQTWPHCNPSDLWYFLVSRAYVDPYNHPADFARLDFGQSWKRTGGWALEKVVVRHYADFLRQHGVEIAIVESAEKKKIAQAFGLSHRVEPDKIDVVLRGVKKGGPSIGFGVVHVKASFAERRTDDVPLSEALVKAGYFSPLWTLDCKAAPSGRPLNRGELGSVKGAQFDGRSAKRKDIEDEEFFSDCFSYNLNTNPTPPDQVSRHRVHTCSFSNPDDAFSRAVIEHWRKRN